MKIFFKDIFLSLIIIFIFNSVFICISFWTETSRSIINIDYFLVLPFLFFKKNILYFIAFFIISFFDFIGIFFQIYPIIRLEDLLYLLKFSLISSEAYKLYSLIGLILIFVQIFLIKKVYAIKQNLILVLFFNIFLIILIFKYFLNIYNDNEIKKNTDKLNYIVSSSLIEYVQSRNNSFLELFEKKGYAFQEVKKEKRYINTNNKKILLIINESWGIPYDVNIQNEVIKPILDLKNNRIENFILDKKEFSGFTISAELRELCGVIPLHYNLKNQNIGFERCIPNVIKKNGYKTVAVHGALSLMYDRKYWYPRAGFGKILFRDSGLNLPYSRCFSFPGNCDSDIALRVIEEFKKNDKIFLYWLTLNTHAIYDLRDLKNDDFNCKIFNILEDSDVCRNLKLQRQFFSTLAQVVSSSALDGTKVIVVGDHAPPLMNRDKNNVFFKDFVPNLEFSISLE